MKIAFHGAARCVTGSKHILTLNSNKKILLDCGMFQGMGFETDGLNRTWGFDPKDISYLVLSHAHVDHSGLIPKLVSEGFKGKIFCTPATRELTTVLLEDSAGIQEDEIKYVNKKPLTQEGCFVFIYLKTFLRNQLDREQLSIPLSYQQRTEGLIRNLILPFSFDLS